MEDTTLTARYVNYFDLDGVEKKPENVDLLYGGSNVKLYGGWTAITQDVNVTKSFVVKEDTNLILADGCTIDSEVSIEIYPNATLTIWGQRDGTGTLKVSGGTGYAGIGSYEDRSDGNLVINGGTVLATGGEGGMGIGDASYSYDHRRFGSITVNGGIVKANGGLGGENVRTTLSWNRNSDQIYANRFEGDITLDRVFDYKGSNEAATLPLKAGGTLVPHYHTMTEHPGTAPTLDEEGSETYYTCQACGNVYRDAEGKEKLNNYPVVIPALSHTWGNVTYTSAVQDGQMNVTAKRYCDRHDHSEEASCIAERSTVRASTCAVKGEYEYTANFSEDWAGTHIWREEAELSNDHTLQHITGSEPGFEEYYNCTVCDRLFDDENGTHEIAKAVESVISGDYSVEQRTLLELVSPPNVFGDVRYALNELNVIRNPEHSLLAIKVFVDDIYLNTYWGDGILLATPTGSTAYSLSAGGPIIAPNAKNFVITPIATHNLTVRPVVIPDDSTIRIQVEGREKRFVFSMDSRSCTLDTSVQLEVRKAGFCINLVRMRNEDFFGTIRNKLMWGKDNRN